MYVPTVHVSDRYVGSQKVGVVYIYSTIYCALRIHFAYKLITDPNRRCEEIGYEYTTLI